MDPRERRRRLMHGAVNLEIAADQLRAEVLAAGPRHAAPEVVDLGPVGEFPTAAPLVLAGTRGRAEEVAGRPAFVTDETLNREQVAAIRSAMRPAPALTWRSRHDERSRAYAARPQRTPLHDVRLPVGPVLDQGAEGACVGAALVNAINTLELAPPRGRRVGFLGMTDADRLYREAQRLDEVPGEAYVGTSVLAGLKAAKTDGLIGGYRWCFGTRAIADTVLGGTPVVVGIPWRAGMYDTGPGGLVSVSGEEVGGHCLEVAAVRLTGPQGQPGPYFGWWNSWGDDYGDGGWGWVHHRDLSRLLAGRGEAAVPSLDPVVAA